MRPYTPSFIVFSLLALLLSSAAMASTLQDKTAPAIELRGLISGDPSTLAQFKGKVVYLDFWASWCGPCQKSLPQLNILRNELKNKGFEIIAINLDQNPNDGRKFLKAHPVDYVVLSDPKGKTPRSYQVKAMPTSYLIDKNGIIRMVHAGFREGDIEHIRAETIKLLKE